MKMFSYKIILSMLLLISHIVDRGIMIRIHLSRLLGEHKEKIADLQRATGLARNTLSGLYREDVARIDLATLDAICQHYGCTVGDVLEYQSGDTDG